MANLSWQKVAVLGLALAAVAGLVALGAPELGGKVIDAVQGWFQ